MPENLNTINKKLIEILSREKGYLGRYETFELKPNKYEFIGYELSESFVPILNNLEKKDVKKFTRMLTYFELHASPLKRVFNEQDSNSLDNFYSKVAWSHFITLIMFGLLEFAVKDTPWAINKKNSVYLDKIKSIKNFLDGNLSEEVKSGITRRYRTLDYIRFKTFDEVITHMWGEIRSGFVHDIGIEYKDSQWESFSGSGTKEDPFVYTQDVPMQEFLQITWQAILNSFGYTGTIRHPKLEKEKKKAEE
jgi:hypothetical protein